MRIILTIRNYVIFGLLFFALTGCSNTINIESLKAEAEKGNAEAQFKLGNRYLGGEGVKKDHAETVKWYRKAAEQGFALAKEMLQRIEN
ncbi:MAG: sel1 repeat family protein [Planctomycetaceae bacterium]|nr:sel1 repeat family protein [Planctomycetaceae bacterium]